MKIKLQITVFLSLLSILILPACGPGQLFGPTLTPTPTSTSTPTLTPTPTITPTATATHTASPTPACLAANGNWESKETSDFFGGRVPILTFVVSNCEITSWEIRTYPVPGELLTWQGTFALSITDNQFAHNEDTGMGIFSLEGIFDSATSSHGTLNFPKGFSVFGTILTKDVTLSWTAIRK
jgi:hypothetical protein